MKCEASTANRTASGGPKAHPCDFRAELTINGKSLCIRHARIEALAIAIKNGKAVAIAQLPPNAIGPK